ncbi:MAG: CRISPR-associated endonuclease Cas3'', partial [Nannocystaceae bacterium]
HALGSSQTKPKLSVTTVYRKISNDDTNTTAQKLWQVALVEPQQVQEATTEDDVSAFSGVEVSLASHLEDVRAWATWFASAGNIGEQISEDIALAALLHDIGKADWRFQAMLRGGDPVHVGEPIAKSRLAGSAKTRARAAQRSTWPRGFRHELISLALFDASPDLQTQAHDLDLVRHLIASHHGWCRPWPPAAVDENPQTVTCEVAGVQAKVSTAALDENTLNQCVSRFRRLTRRYGWHGLAYLEAVLRLGDHQASRTPGEHPSPGS